MNRRAVLLLLLVCFVLEAGRGQILLGQDSRPPLILISFDGLRWDYRTTYSAPNLTRLAAKGVSADLIPSYPSKTFPNHYTIVTGLYPGHHGIVANTVKDPPTGRRLSMSNSVENRDAMWWGGEPIWVTVQRAGLLSASMFWVGSEAPIEGHRPNIWSPFNDALSSDCARRSHPQLAGPTRRQAADSLDALHRRRRRGRTQPAGPGPRPCDRLFAALTVTWAACCAAWRGAT